MAAKHREVEDPLTKITKKLEKFITRYIKVIIVSVAVVVFVLATYFSLDYIFKRKEIKANSAFGKVYLVYRDIIDNEDLEEEELGEKLLDLIEKFEAVIEEYPKSSIASKSAYFIGSNLYKAERYNEAKDYFQEAYRMDSKSLELRPGKSNSYIALLCLKGEASCYEQLEEYEKAEKAYMEIIDRFDDSFILPLVRYNLGQLYEKQDKFEMAEREYSQIVNEYEWSSWKELAEKRLLLIKSFI